jgi:hypothetical protein
MAHSDGTPRPLSRLRLFCIAFIVTFVGVTANLWMLHWLPRLFDQLDQRDELIEPSGGGASRLPLLASIDVHHSYVVSGFSRTSTLRQL